jgi:hypothetical protein
LGLQQVHDFSPGIASNGLFWIVQVPDDAVKITEDTLTISLKNVSVVDQFRFPGGAGNNLGAAGVPATVSFDITYTKSGTPRHVAPRSHDPLSPFAWAGEMWRATNSGTFTVAYNDASFSAQGSFSSDTSNPDTSGFGEMGTERNGSFVVNEQGNSAMGLSVLKESQSSTQAGQMSETNSLNPPLNTPTIKGRVPLTGSTVWIPPARNR